MEPANLKHSLLICGISLVCACGTTAAPGTAGYTYAPPSVSSPNTTAAGSPNTTLPTSGTLPTSTAPPLTIQNIVVDNDPNGVVGGYVNIVTQSKPSECLDLTSGAPTLQLCSGAPSQNWTFKQGLLITPGNACLAVVGTTMALVSCDLSLSTPNQIWSYEGGLLQTTAGCMSLRSNNNAAGAQVIVATCSATDAQQQWAMANEATSMPHGAMLGALDSNTCLDVLANNLVNNATVDVYACNGTRAQQWVFDNGIIRIGSYCLQANVASNANQLTMNTCGGGSQDWAYEAGVVRLSGSNTCLIQPGPINNFAKPTLGLCNTSATNQQWFLGAQLAVTH